MPLTVPTVTSSLSDAHKLSIAPFPAQTARAVGLVNGIRTQVMSICLTDKILITISQDGRLAHWVQVSLDSQDPNGSNRRTIGNEEDVELLPMSQLNARTLLGGSASDRDILGQLFAAQIASAIVTKDPQERRLLVLGMAFQNVRISSQGYMQVLDIVLQCI